MKKHGKEFNFDIISIIDHKDATGALVIKGYANTVDKDRVNDVVLPTAFANSLPMYMKNPMMLYMHNWEQVIGRVEKATIDDKGLMIEAVISGADDCKDIRTKIREKILRTFSIGYNELESNMDRATDTKIVTVLELLEISIVSIPANPEATFDISGQEGQPPAATPPAATTPPASEPPKSAPQTAGKENNMSTQTTAAKTDAAAPGATPPPAATPPAATPPANEGDNGEGQHAARVIQLLEGILAALAGMNDNMKMICENCNKPGQPPKQADPLPGKTTPPADVGKSIADIETQIKELEITVAELERLQPVAK